METKTYKDLIVYNKAYEMTIEIYKATKEDGWFKMNPTPYTLHATRYTLHAIR